MNIVEIVASGIMGTVFLDLWQQGLRLATGLPAGNWGLVGRWFGHAARGTFFHEPIAKAEPVNNEIVIGWVGHYAVGVLYGLVYVVLIRTVLGLEPSLANGLVFGVASVVVPWFYFMPAMGAGVLGNKTAAPLIACLQSLASHTACGLGLAVGSLMVA
ncbi:MAG: DUF2938 family protein [Proteobacteria bacterium]|nr:DUF2938 family protein [Pseudomonadota bacterium]MBI3497623.1 DUF2938 family protein [Pseudomonadota bacterium]